MARAGGLPIGAGVGVWAGRSPHDAGALFDADFANDRYSLNGTQFPTKAAFLTAIGGVEASGAYLIGPYVDPAGPELVTNGSFASDVSGWGASKASGADPSAAWASPGLARLTGAATNVPSFRQAITVAPGRAYRMRGWIARGPGNTTQHPVLAASGNATMASQWHWGNTTTNSSNTLAERVLDFSHFGTTLYVGLMAFYNPGNLAYDLDDVSVRECIPCAGLPAGALSGVIAARTPGSISERVLWQADHNASEQASVFLERDMMRLVWGADAHLRFVVSTQTAAGTITTHANIDLGMVPVSTNFRVAWSAEANSFAAALDGGPALTDASGAYPGLAVMRIGKGRAPTSPVWVGQIDRVTIYAGARASEVLEDASAANPAALIAAWGDSLTAGGMVPLAVAEFSPARAISNRGVGGQTSTQIAARQGGLPIDVTLSGNAIPASGGVAVTAKSVNVLYNAGSFTGTTVGTLRGVAGTMSTDGSGNWTFTRSAPGTAVPCPSGSRFLPESAARLRSRTQWLWLGRNGAEAGHTIEGDIAAAVASLGHDRYLVGAILTGTMDNAGAIAAILARNAVLASTYGVRFVDLLGILQAANDGSPDDLADVAAGYTPRSLRSDGIHLNSAGNGIVAGALHDATIAMGW